MIASALVGPHEVRWREELVPRRVGRTLNLLPQLPRSTIPVEKTRN